MHYMYIIHSVKVDYYYIVETMDLERRLQEHNQGVFKGCFTRRSDDWVYALQIPFSNKTKAQQAERFVKKMNSRRFVERLLKESEWLRMRFENG